MPVLKHAKKKLRQDKKRTAANAKIKDTFKSLVKEAKLARTPDALSKAFSGLDKAAKHHVIHKNKAARLKSSLSKLLTEKPQQTAPSKSPKTPKRTSKKKSSSKAKKS